MTADMADTDSRAGSTRRRALGEFLRSVRARVTPAAVGLPAGTRRRTPGLRREEVAQLCGISVTWYTWLEQGRVKPIVHAQFAALEPAAGLPSGAARAHALMQGGQHVGKIVLTWEGA